MSGVFQNIDPPTSLTARRVRIPLPLVQGEDTLAGWRGGWGVNILEDARHCYVIYIRKYFVVCHMTYCILKKLLNYCKSTVAYKGLQYISR